MNTTDYERWYIIQELEHAANQALASPLRKSRLRDTAPAPAAAVPVLSRQDLVDRVVRAVEDGKLDASYITKVNGDPRWLNTIPLPIRKSYGLPSVDDNGLLKSLSGDEEDIATTHDQIAERLLHAVHAGALDPRVLGAFASHPEDTLRGLPADVCKSYGVPQPTRPAPRRQPMYSDPPWLKSLLAVQQ